MTVCLTMLNKCNKCSLNMDKYNFMSSNERIVSVVLLDDNVLDICVEVKSTIGDLFKKICNKLELKEFDIFGLAIKIKNEYHMLENNEKLSKLLNSSKRYTFNSAPGPFYNAFAPNNTFKNKLFNNLNSNIINSFNLNQFDNFGDDNDEFINAFTYSHYCKSSSSISTSMSLSNKNYTQASLSELSSCSCVYNHRNLTFFFRVKYYVSDPLLLSEPKTRYLYYLQLRHNYLTINHKLSEEKYFSIASLALLADYGPFNPQIHTKAYFNIELYFPKWIINKLGHKFIIENMARLHKLSRYTPLNAQNKFCFELSNDEYPFNIHLYNVYKNKDETPGSICLGLAPKGILVFDLRPQLEISLISTFSWSSVVKVNSDKKKFEVVINLEATSRKYTYYTNEEKFSKYLLTMAKLTHEFSSNIFARLASQKTLAHYVDESYSNRLLSCKENEQSEVFEEREINENKKTFEIKKMPPCETSNSSSKKSNNANVSFSSTSSSGCFETALCLNHNDSIDCIKNFDEEISLNQIESDNEEIKNRSFQKNNQEQIEDHNEVDEHAKEEEDEDHSELIENSTYYNLSLFSSQIINSTQINEPCIPDSAHDKSTNESLNTIETQENINNNNFNSNKSKHKSPAEYFDLKKLVHLSDLCKQLQTMPIDLELKSDEHGSNALRNNQFSTKSAILNTATSPTLTQLSCFGELNHRKTIPTKKTRIEQVHAKFSLPTKLSSPNKRSTFMHNLNSPYKSYSDTNSFDEIYQKQSVESNGNQELDDCCSGIRKKLKIQNLYAMNTNSFSKSIKKPPSYEESLRKINNHSLNNELEKNGYVNIELETNNQLRNGSLSNKHSKLNGDQKVDFFDTFEPTSSTNESYSDNNETKSEILDNDKINLSIENLEQIRLKATSMSLPLLAALCSDQSLIKSLNRNKSDQIN